MDRPATVATDRWLIPLCFLALAAAMPAATASERETVKVPETALDGSYITMKEVRRYSDRLYEAFAGPDGGPLTRDMFVTRTLPQEVVPAAPDRQLLEKLFPVLDANGDGKLTRAEWNSRLEEDLRFADENGDGRISLQELANARENMGFGDALQALF